MFLKFNYYKKYFFGHRFGIKYFNFVFLNNHFRIFFYLLESFCQSGCNVFFLGNDLRFGAKFFDNLSKFYLQNLNKPFYRALLTNDYNYKSESFMSGDLYPAVEHKLLLQANLRGWENSSLFMSNINLISNLKRNIYLVLSGSNNLIDYKLLNNRNNIVIFIGFESLVLYFNNYRLFLDLDNEHSYKYLQFIVIFLLNIFSLNVENYSRFLSFYNFYSLLKWKKNEWYSSNFFFSNYSNLKFSNLNNFLKLKSKVNLTSYFLVNSLKLNNWFFVTKYFNFFSMLLEKKLIINGTKNNLNFSNNQYLIFDRFIFFFLKKFKSKSTFYYGWKNLNHFWIFFYFLRIYELLSYKKFLVKNTSNWLQNSLDVDLKRQKFPIILNFLNNFLTKVNKNIYKQTNSIINNYVQNVYYFKNLKILNLNYTYNYFFFSRYFYDSYFSGSSHGVENFFWTDFFISGLPNLILKIKKLNFFLNSFNLLNYLNKTVIKKFIYYFFFKNLQFIWNRQWFFFNLNFIDRCFVFWNCSHFFLLQQSRFTKLIYQFLIKYLFKCGKLLIAFNNTKKSILYYSLLKEKFLILSDKKFKLNNSLNFFYKTNYSYSFFSSSLFYQQKLLKNFNHFYLKNILRLKIYFYRLFFSFFWSTIFYYYCWTAKLRQKHKKGYDFVFLKKKIIFFNKLLNNRKFFFFFLMRKWSF